MSSPPQTSPTAPQIRTTTTEQTGIHYSTIYLHTVPGTLKCICLVILFLFLFHFQMFHVLSIFFKMQIFIESKCFSSAGFRVDWFYFGAM